MNEGSPAREIARLLLDRALEQLRHDNGDNDDAHNDDGDEDEQG